MADLMSLLKVASGALTAHRQSSATASHNLQNVNTPGYARQRAELVTQLPAERVAGAYVGRGVTLGGISQARDAFVESQVAQVLGRTGHAQVASDALLSVHALDPSLQGGPAEALSGFYESLRALSQNPADLGARQAFLGKAQTLAQAFRGTASALDEARDGLDARISSTVAEVNALAPKFAELNAQIRTARANGGAPNDLLDERQRLQDTLVRLTGVSPVTASNGDVSLAFPSGAALVTQDIAFSLVAIPSSAGGHLGVQVSLGPSGGTRPLSGSALSGELGGALEARDGALAEAETALDTLAFEFASTLNAVHQSGVGLDGSSGRPLFDVSATSAGAAKSLTVHAALLANPRLLGAAASGSVASGDNRTLLALLGTQSSALGSGQTPEAAFAHLVSTFGAHAASASAARDHAQGLEDHLLSQRESISGVSIDEELIQLTQSQRAFEAVSKVIQTTDEMLQTLMNLK